MKKMNVTIEIHYNSDSRALQKGNFPLRDRKAEYVALEFWKHIQKNMSHRGEIEKIIVEGDKDITQRVIDLEKEEWHKAMNDNLPF
jgi:exonuclease III